jgi:hypothetical protein
VYEVLIFTYYSSRRLKTHSPTQMITFHPEDRIELRSYVEFAEEKEQELFELLKNQAQSMLQNGLLAVSDLVKIYKNDSMAELEATIKYKELKLEQNQQQQVQP